MTCYDTKGDEWKNTQWQRVGYATICICACEGEGGECEPVALAVALAVARWE